MRSKTISRKSVQKDRLELFNPWEEIQGDWTPVYQVIDRDTNPYTNKSYIQQCYT